MSSEYEQQLEKRNEELQSKLTALQTTHLEMEAFSVDLTKALVRFVKGLKVNPIKLLRTNGPATVEGAEMSFVYRTRQVTDNPGEEMLKKLIDGRYEYHMEWEKQMKESRDIVQKVDKMISISRTEDTGEPFRVTKIVRHEKE
jgi:hypothetical protein